MFMESADRLKKAILSTDGNTISLKRIYEFISDILEMDSNELVVQNYYTCVKLIECLIAEFFCKSSSGDIFILISDVE